MKKAHGVKILIVFALLFLGLSLMGCKRKVSKYNSEVNAMMYFLKIAEYDGPITISELKKASYDDNTLIFYYKWNYISGENTKIYEHLLVFNIKLVESIMYPVDKLDNYPEVKQQWNVALQENKITVYSKEKIDFFVSEAKLLREALKQQQNQ